MLSSNRLSVENRTAQLHEASDDEVQNASSRLIAQNRAAYQKLAGDIIESGKDTPSPNH